MKKTAALFEKLLSLCHGNTLPDSVLRGEWFTAMKRDGILIAVTHGSRKSWRAAAEQTLRRYVADSYGLPDIEACLELFKTSVLSRAEMVEATGDSKFLQQRSFKGFAVNCYKPVKARLHGREITIRPEEGLFTFIYDWEGFTLPPEVIVVGIENAENFRLAARQRTFFERYVSARAPLLFVSRYPQNGDLARWLLNVTNRYVHFGDYDLAGVHIYLTEIYKYLGDRAVFLVSDDYDERISRGSQQRYNAQYGKFQHMKVPDRRVLPLVESINRWHRGYDQEGFIGR